MSDFVIKDSGDRQQFKGGMVRDTAADKVDYSLILDGPMFDRWAEHLTKGAKKYAKRNWMKAEGQEELERFKESALRHFIQWYRGELDEDHASAVFFNINGYEYVADKIEAEQDAFLHDDDDEPDPADVARYVKEALDMADFTEKLGEPGALVALPKGVTLSDLR